MARYGSLDEIYKNIAAIEGATGKKLAVGKESAYFSQSLIRLKDDVPLSVKNIDELSVENLNRSAGAAVLMREGIRQSAKQLDPDIKPPVIGDTTVKEIDKSLFGAADEKDYKIILDLGELKSLLDKASKQKLLALDFETDSLDAWGSTSHAVSACRPVGISLALKPKEAFYVDRKSVV